MKKETKQRFAIACLGILLSVPAAFVGGGLAGSVIHLCESGMANPPVIGWTAVFIMHGLLLGLVPAAPSLLVMVVFHVVWRPALGRHALMATVFSFLLGGMATASAFMLPETIEEAHGFLIASAACLATVVLVEMLMKKQLRANIS